MMDRKGNLLIFFVAAVILFFNFVPKAFSENWYLINECDLTLKDDNVFRVRIAAKTEDENACYELAGMREGVLAGGKLMETSCLSGKEYDAALGDVFSKVPKEEPYIHLKDKYGNETVIDFLFVEEKDFDFLTGAIVDECRKEGFTEIEVIKPKGDFKTAPETEYGIKALVISPEPEDEDTEKEEEPEKQEESLSIGSSREEVKRVMGRPAEKIGKVWFFGKDMIIFDENGRVADFSDFSGNLKIER